MFLTKTSILTGKSHRVYIPISEEEYELGMAERRTKGKNIQDVFPQLSSECREFIMTGITAQEWKEAFQEE